MSRIDVSELLTDPDFVDAMIHVERVPKVNSRGENTIQEQKNETVGCIQPASGKTIQRLPEAFRLENVSQFFMKGVITASAPGKYSDVLIFKGVKYQVRMVFDWSNWGAGYCEGVCVAQVPA